VSPDTILLSNVTNGKVQMFYTTGELVSEVKLQGLPQYLCLIRIDQAAVAVGQIVQIIDIQSPTIAEGTVLKTDVQKPSLATGTVVEVEQQPFGITTLNDTSFVVSYYASPYLEVRNTDGEVLHQFDDDADEYLEHFEHPANLTTSADNYVYVSDSGRYHITKLDFNLQPIQVFTSKELPWLEWPEGIISISPDQLLVCCNDSVMLLNPRTGNSSILLNLHDGNDMPNSLTYCPKKKRLYVAMNSIKGLNVYELS